MENNRGLRALTTKYIGSREFYSKLLKIMVPILVQNGVMQFVNMLDNLMVGNTGTVNMTGVAVANQLIFVFNLCVFGAVSGAGIFTAQFHGAKNTDGVRDSFRFKVLISIIISVVAAIIMIVAKDQLINMFLSGEGNVEDIQGSSEAASIYLMIMLGTFLPYSISSAYSDTLRSTGKQKIPMIASIIAVCVNLTLNYVLIFDHPSLDSVFGCKIGGLGVAGAAIATVISRFVEMGYLIIWTYRNREICPFIKGAFKTLLIPVSLAREMVKKGLPLMFNETFWSLGMTVLNQAYSIRGYDVVSANSISTTFFNIFSIVFIASGNAIGIICGNHLGRSEIKEAADSARKAAVFSIFLSTVFGIVFASIAPFIPYLYDTTDSIRQLSMLLMFVTAFWMPIDAYANASYFTLRSGGQILITILADSCYVWAVMVPISHVLIFLTDINIVWVYFIVQGATIGKDILGLIFVKKGLWLRNIVKK